MNLDDIEVKVSEPQSGRVKAKVTFPEDSDSGLRIHTDFVVRKVKDKGYDVLEYVSTDTLTDESGEEKVGVWEFFIPDDEFVDKLQEIKGIGKVKAKKIISQFDEEELKDLAKKGKRKFRKEVDLKEKTADKLRKSLL